MEKKYRDCHLYYQVAREAVQLEKDGEYDRDAKVWMKAAGESINRVNEEWAIMRANFCHTQITREKIRKEFEGKKSKGGAA
ncbi:ANR family transcriptional regulator [Salmonella enterica]|uniref:ANR family transcriptional regulator n=1 Tax=Salmonella enterica TaxID=28901 RepID=UPI00193E0C22|nr:ANR family transcriptional regulator [Salmonella enterica subsp. enterica serovar Mountpleasant]